jgi:hypothetical protein
MIDLALASGENAPDGNEKTQHHFILSFSPKERSSEELV